LTPLSVTLKKSFQRQALQLISSLSTQWKRKIRDLPQTCICKVLCTQPRALRCNEIIHFYPCCPYLAAFVIFRKFKHTYPLVWHSFTFICYTTHHTNYKRKYTLSHIYFYNTSMFACFNCTSHINNFGYNQVVRSVFTTTAWAGVTFYF
jgi:hypothetical protein